jgi:hypothetical protein
MNNALRILPLWLLALVCACSMSPLSGGSSQQGNGVMVGRVVSARGVPVIDARIRVRPSDYVETPGSIPMSKFAAFDAITDTTGRFSVSGIVPGRYAVEANDEEASAALIQAGVKDRAGVTDVGTVGLKPYTQITGVVASASAVSSAPFYIQVRGLERLVRVGLDGTFAISDLPEGSFSLRLVSVDSSVTPAELSGVGAPSDSSVTVVIPAAWRYSRRIILNTTPSGADIAGGVTNFPVLVRLTSENFDFGQAKSRGADIRFTKSDTFFLPYDIERWDSAKGAAEIWVKVDTVRGNDGTQSITMHWGNPGAVDGADAAKVFDTAAGFSAVLHMGDRGDSVHDATYDAWGGKNSGSATVSGIIGNSKSFAFGNYIKISGLLKSPANLTLSAWVRTDTSVSRGQDIVSIGDAALIRFDDVLGMGTAGCYHNTAQVSDSNYAKVNSGRYLAKTGWHHLAFSIDGVKHVQALYIDGELAGISHDTNRINYSGLGTDTYIGMHGNGKTFFNFVGQIDEVRAYRAAMSADYIKLCFMNQNDSKGLLVFR